MVRFVALIAVTLLSCSDDTLSKLPPGPPQIVAEPARLVYEIPEIGATVRNTLLLRNVGEQTLEIAAIGIEGEIGFAFTLVDATLPYSVESTEALELEVTFSPTTQDEALDTLWVDSNDPESPHLTVPLVAGERPKAAIECTPNPLSMVTQPPMVVSRQVHCQSVGQMMLTVTEIQQAAETSDAFNISWPGLPLDLESTQSFAIDVSYAPAALGSDAGSLTIVSNAADGDYIVTLAGEASTDPICLLSAWPFMVGFGETTVGSVATRNVTLSNNGMAPCNVNEVKTLTVDAPFGYSGTVPFTIAPFTQHSLTIEFTPPDRFSHQDIVMVNTVEGAGASIVVSGGGVGGELVVSPCPVRFGTVMTGCEEQRQVTMRNVGNAPLTLSSTVPAGDFSLLTAAPSSLAAGASATLDLSFLPTLAGDKVGSLDIASNDPFQPNFSCELRGSASDDGHVVEIFDTATPEVDVLLIVDDSGSMEDQAQTLIDSVPTLVDHLVAMGVSFHLGAVTTDVSDDNPIMPGKQGRLLGTDNKIITNSTPNPRQALLNNVSSLFTGDAEERGLEAARLALSEPLVSNDNAGFLRPNASLYFIFLSDEEDKSPAQDALWEVSTYADIFLGIKGGDRNRVGATAVVTLPGDECGLEAIAAQRYIDLVDIVGGTVASICVDNFGPALTDVGSAITDPPDTFYLESTPVGGTIRVFVDDVEQAASAWVYDPTDDTISFNAGFDPPVGAVVRIEYDTSC